MILFNKTLVRDTLDGATRSNRLLDAVSIATLAAIAVAYPLYTFLAQNPAYFITQRVPPSNIITLTILFSLVLPIMILSVLLVNDWLHKKRGGFVRALIVAGLFTLAFMPMTRQIADNPDGGISSWIAVALSLIIGIALTHQAFTNAIFYNGLLLLSPAVFIVPTIFILDSEMQQTLNARANYTSEVQPVQPKNTPPIILIVFDELPTLSLLDEYRQIDPDRFSNFARLADTGTWYPNATTVHDFTPQAVPAILCGRNPLPGQLLPLPQNYPTSLFHLLSDSYQIHALEQATSLNVNTDMYKNRASLLSLTTDLAAMFAHSVLPQKIAEECMPMDENLWGGFFVQQQDQTFHPDGEFIQWLSDRLGAWRSKDRASQCRSFIQQIQHYPEATFHFAHIMLPHQPYTYLPSGKLYNSKFWPVAADTEDAHRRRQRHRKHALLLQLGLADKLLGEFLDELQRLERFNDSLIIAVADHGISFRDQSTGRELNAENLPEIAMVPLIIKYPNQQKPRVDATNAQITDIVPTIVEQLNCETIPNFDGRSLLDDKVDPSEFKFIMSRHGQIFTPTTLELVEAQNVLHEQWVENFHLDNPRTTMYQYGPRLDALGLPTADIEGIAMDASIQSIQEQQVSQPISTENALPALVTGVVTVNEPATQQPLQLLIALNGEVVAQTPVFVDRGAARFCTVLPEDLINLNGNTIRFFVIPDKPLDTLR